MASSLKCKIAGCDLDKCGVHHQWQEAERHRPCFHLKVCELCKTEKETPEHDWETKAGVMEGTTALKCSRCGLSI